MRVSSLSNFRGAHKNSKRPNKKEIHPSIMAVPDVAAAASASAANYAEVVIAKGADVGMFERFKRLAAKMFPLANDKSFREFVFRDFVCEIADNHQSYVYRKRFLLQDPATDMFVFQKDKQPYHTFPSCKQLHGASTVGRITFRIKNSVNLVLESRKYKDDTKLYCKLYITNGKDASIPTEVIKSVRAKLSE